ncbi:MAG: DUF58 domain-containing protein [Bacteroidales bacterium]|jgi:uncharacterized protein (DUF58 family)|nr:DUF58 domain-containing protein [Bacteroidales bacterium]
MNIEAISGFELLARQVVEGFITGMHKSPFHGFSVEFAEHRLYNNGESTRHIDWKMYAKTEKLFVKRYEEETNLRCYILMDTSMSMHFENKFRFACEAAACLIYLIAKQRDVAGLTFFDKETLEQTELKSSVAHQKYLFGLLDKYDEMSNVGNRPATSVVNHKGIAEILDELAEQIHKRSMVIIFSDMFDDFAQSERLFSALQHLKFKQNDVILFHTAVKDKEIEFNYNNRPYRFIDLENNKELKINPETVRNAYQNKMKQYQQELKYRCQQYGIDYVRAYTDEGFYQILTTFLLARMKRK